MIMIITNTDPNKGETVINCNPNLVHVKIPVHSNDWFKFRTTGISGIYEGGIGASEVSTFLQVGAAKYRPVLPELMEIKAGVRTKERDMNESMLSGILAEPTILERWRYWDGSGLGYVDNFLNGRKIRGFGLVNSYIYNKRFPWLFCSLDAFIRKGYSNLWGEELDKDSPLECKTIGFQAAKSNPLGLPESYVYQVQTQMLITETDYAEIAILEGGLKFTVEPFRFDPEIGEKILTQTFEHYTTIQTIKAMNKEREALKMSGNWGKVEQIEAEIQSMLPLPSGGDAYNEYYSEIYDDSTIGVEVSGSKKEYTLIERRQLLNAVIKELDLSVSEIDNYFRHQFVSKGCSIISFGDKGIIQYKKKAGGKNFYPDYSKVKGKADPNDYEPIISYIIDQIKQ